eukprot:Rmarinus@m.18314
MTVGVVEAKTTAGRWTSVFNLSNTALGAGILAFPTAFDKGGYAVTSILLVVVSILATQMVRIIVRAADHYDVPAYHLLVLRAIGARAARPFALVLLFMLYGACVTYLIIIGDMLSHPLNFWIPDDQGFFFDMLRDRLALIAFVGCFICLPLCFVKTLSALASVSTLSLCGVLYTTVAVVIRGVKHVQDHGPADGFVPVRSGKDCVEPIPIIVFAFLCHIQVPQIFSELADPLARKTQQPVKGVVSETEPVVESQPEGSALLRKRAESMSGATWILEQEQRHRRRDEMGAVGALTMGMCALLYLTVGVFGYLEFGDSVESNVLNEFADDDELINIGRVSIAVVSLASFPVNFFAARVILSDKLPGNDIKDENLKEWRERLITLCFFAMVLFCSLIVDDLGIVFQIIGSTAGVAVMFMIPGFLLIDPRGPWAVQPEHHDPWASLHTFPPPLQDDSKSLPDDLDSEHPPESPNECSEDVAIRRALLDAHTILSSENLREPGLGDSCGTVGHAVERSSATRERKYEKGVVPKHIVVCGRCLIFASVSISVIALYNIFKDY